MKTFDDLWKCMFAAIGVLGLLVFFFGPPKVAVSPDPTPTVIFDGVTADQIARVEEMCRRYIELWESDLELYNETADSDIPKVQEIHKRVKTRMNEIADSYNRYLLINSYVFNGILPDGIYACIERIGDTDE